MGLEGVETYVLRHQNIVAHCIATCLVLDICLTAEQHPEAQVNQWWWEQAGLNLVQEARRAAEQMG